MRKALSGTMQKISFLLILLIICQPAYAVNLKSIELNQDGAVIEKANGEILEITYADYPGIDLEAKLPAVQSFLQDWYDVKIKRSTLPQDDPDRQSDPALPYKFWSGGDIVYRGTLVTVFIENGRYNIMLQVQDVNS